MALNITQKFSIDLNGVIENSIAAVKAIRRSEQTRKEAEFQRAIANGLSYDAQIAMRETQLEDEKKSSISDVDYIGTLEKFIADTKKLNRFNKYRTRYAEFLGELSSGKINEEQYLSTLKNQLNSIDEPELRREIQGDIAVAEKQVKTYTDTILSNQVKKAKYDGTKSALDEVISRVNTARAQALISDNQDEVTAYDETLSALNSQRSSVGIQDSITDFQVKSSTRGTNPIEKLNYINSEIQGADSNTPIKIGDRSYTSAQQFWNLERDNFLGGENKIFGNFFEELNVHTKNAINVNAAKFGYPTQTILDEASSTFNELRTKPEMTPFLNRLDITKATVMSEAVDKLAKTINAVATSNLSFKEGDVQLQNIATRYGIDVSGYRLQLQDISLKQAEIDRNKGIVTQKEAEKTIPEVNIPLPKVEIEKPVPPTVPGVTPVIPAKPMETSIVTPTPTPTPTTPPKIPTLTPTPTTPVTPPPIKPVQPSAIVPAQNYREVVVMAGETLSGILNRETGLALSKENESKYAEVAKLSGIADPNKIKPGQKIKIPI